MSFFKKLKSFFESSKLDAIKKGYSPVPSIQLQQRKYYKDYDHIPYFSSKRDKQWEEMVALFPSYLVNKEMMILNEDRLFPGDIYLMYWVNRYKGNKKVPVYFEYKYGINFNERLSEMRILGYLDENSLTAKGEILLKKYERVIQKHSDENRGIQKIDRKAEIAKFKEQQKLMKQAGIKPTETLKERKAFLDQQEGIQYYKQKDYKMAEKKLLSAINNGFCSPGGLDYLAKIYRKRKDYASEVSILERGIQIMENSTDFKNSSQSAEDRLVKARVLLNKQK